MPKPKKWLKPMIHSPAIVAGFQARTISAGSHGTNELADASATNRPRMGRLYFSPCLLLILHTIDDCVPTAQLEPRHVIAVCVEVATADRHSPLPFHAELCPSVVIARAI